MPVEGSISVVGAEKPCYVVGDVLQLAVHATFKYAHDGSEDDPDGPDRDDEPEQDVSDQCEWRRYGQVGSTVTITVSENEVKHPTIAVYYHGTDVGSRTFVFRSAPCKAAEGFSDEEKLLAQLMYAEGQTAKGGDEERRALGQTVVNRVRYGRKTHGHHEVWPDSLSGVIHQSGQFLAVGNDAWNAAANSHCMDSVQRPRQQMSDCEKLKRCLEAARAILADADGAGDQIWTDTGDRPFYFNQANGKYGPDGEQSPRIRAKDGWSHQFYGSTRVHP